MKKWIVLDRRCLKLYVVTLFLSILYVFPVILADIYYNDDLARTYYGATGWNGDGRPLAEQLIKLLCGGLPITDLAPLPLILATVFLTYMIIVYTKENLNSYLDNPFLILVLLSIITNPFSMSNLTYRFDCIFMFISLGIPFLIFAIPKSVSCFKVFSGSFLACLIMLSMYQPTIGMCFVLFAISMVISVISSEKKHFSFLWEVWRIGGIGAGAIVYKYIIANYFIDKSANGWRYAASQVVELDFDSIRIVCQNIIAYCRYVKEYLNQITGLNKCALVFTVVLSIIVILSQYMKDRRKGWRVFLDFLLIGLSPMIVFAVTFLPLTLLSVLSIKSRVFISFGGFLFYIGILILRTSKPWKTVISIAFTVCIFSHFVYMYTYCNAIKSQNEYEKYLVYNIAHDLETLNYNGDFNTLSFMGDTPKAVQTQRILNKYPFFNEIVPVNFGNSTWIEGVWVYHYLQGELSLVSIDETDQQAINKMNPILSNSIYSCYVNENRIIVWFR